jgi:undecaprenyl diphosphate synthase
MKSLLDSLTVGSEDWLLATAVDPSRLPQHIAIIMDGNGRWARQRLMPRIAGHRAGVSSVRQCVETCAQLGPGALTLYAFSTENWKRPSFEVQALWRLLRLYLRSELSTLMSNNVRLSAIGRLHELPRATQQELERVIALTAGNTGLQLNLALNYSGRADITDAVRAMLAAGVQPAVVDEEFIGRHLATAGLPDPDLLIRTSGEMRVSNFLLWQIAYSEFVVTNTLWPDFRRSHLLDAILEFQSRDRRFGAVTENGVNEKQQAHAPLPELDLNVLTQ